MVRALTVFFLVGGALFALRRWHEAPPRPPLVVPVARAASAEQTQRAIERAALAARAAERGAMETDPVIVARIRRDFVEDPERAGDEAALDLARTIGAQRVDPWILERLTFQGELALRNAIVVPPPSDAELLAYRRQHATRYRERARFSFVQIPLTRARHGSDLDAAAGRLAGELAALGPEAADDLGDPSLLPRRATAIDEVEVSSTFGAAFTKHVNQASLGRWTGPIASPFGMHMVWVSSRDEGRDRPLAAIREQLRSDFEADARERAYARALAALVAEYDVRVARVGTP